MPLPSYAARAGPYTLHNGTIFESWLSVYQTIAFGTLNVDANTEKALFWGLQVTELLQSGAQSSI